MKKSRYLAVALACWICATLWATDAHAFPSTLASVAPIGTWPLSPTPAVVRQFDPPDAPWAAGHRGVDLAGVAGQPVLAALPGTITFAGPIAGKPVVVIDHGPTRTTYEPVLAAVEVGERVTAGSVIGHLAGAPSHCPPAACLHWGWKRDAEYLDPLTLVNLAPIRLLPLDGSAPFPAPMHSLFN